jgi:uncharacterized membrane protein
MKKNIITGLALLLPLAITFWILHLLYKLGVAPFLHIGTQLIEGLNGRFAIYLPIWVQGIIVILIPIFSLIFILIAITMLGYLTRWYLGQKLVELTEYIFKKMPFVNKLYSAFYKLFETLFSPKKKLFKQTCLVHGFGQSHQALALVIEDIPQGFSAAAKKELIGVFILTAPHPLAGYLAYVPKKDLILLDLSVEDAVRYTVSLGSLVPKKGV